MLQALNTVLCRYVVEGFLKYYPLISGTFSTFLTLANSDVIAISCIESDQCFQF